jgi:hypothetical protein
MDLPLKVSDCSVGMVEDMMGGVTDWKGIQDIIRMTFKAITEVLKNQSISISHLNKQLSSIPENVDRTSEVSKDDLEEVKNLLQEKASKKDLHSALSNKVTLDHLKVKLDSEEFYSEVEEINKKIEKFNEDLSRKFIELSSTKDLQKMHLELIEKASWKEVQEELSKKLDQSALSDLPSKKWIKSELEDQIRFKADSKDLAALSSRIDVKSDKTFVENQINHLSNKIIQNQSNLEKEAFEEKITSVQSSLSNLQKTMKNEIENMKRQTTNALNKKVDYSEVENLYEGIKQKADIKHLEELQEKISKDFKTVLIEFKKDLKNQEKKNGFNGDLISRLSEDVTKIRSQILEVLEDRKKDTIDHAQFLKNSMSQVKSEVKDMVSAVEDQVNQVKDSLSNSFVKKSDLSSLKSDITTLKDQKSSKEDLSLISLSISELKSKIEYLKDKKPLTFKPIETKPELKPDLKPPSKKEKHSKSVTVFESSPDLSTFHLTIQAILQDIDLLKSEQKANSSFLSSQLSSLLSLQESLQNDQKSKLGNKEILALIENKANIEDINTALVEIHKELDGKAENETISGIFSSLQIVQQTWQVGRWNWKSGEVKANNLVPWEVQNVNTHPENLLWEKDKTSIIVLCTGVYFMNFALFYKKKCRVQFNVNGEVIMDSGGKNVIGRNKVFSEFLMIPARARVSVGVVDGSGGVGLLELIKYL